jgi:hypothetical protein
MDKILVMFDVHTTLSFEVCLFFPWLAGTFHNFELTQNREKNKID